MVESFYYVNIDPGEPIGNGVILPRDTLDTKINKILVATIVMYGSDGKTLGKLTVTFDRFVMGKNIIWTASCFIPDIIGSLRIIIVYDYENDQILIQGVTG